jgi:glutamate dehydrogenase/leucine dehydrogenase
MAVIELIEEMGGKKLAFGYDAATGLRCVVAIHSTRLGPAAGGVRFKPYPSGEDAARDAMRLARAMTLKYAAAGMRMGGGKAVIVGDPRTGKSPELPRAFGRFVEEMAGEYSAAEEVGTNGADMVEISRETEWLVSLPIDAGGAGDVSITTAEGVFNAIRAFAAHVWGAPELGGAANNVFSGNEVAERLEQRIFDRTLRIFALADEFDLPLWRAGLRLAEENLDGMGAA